MINTTVHKTERWHQIAEGLRDILEFLNSARTLDEILTFIVEQACHLCDANAGIVYNFDLERRLTQIVALAGMPVESTDQSPSPLTKRSEMHKAVLDGRPFPVPDLAEYFAGQPPQHDGDGGNSQWEALIRTHFHAKLAVPIFIKAQVYGAIELYYAEPRVFSTEEIELAVMLGNQAALAIENARLRVETEQAAVLKERSRLARDLHDSVTQSLYSLTLLAEAARRLANTGDLPRVADAITRLGEIGQQVLKEMRLLVYELRPLALEQVGLVRALQQRLNTVERRAGVTASLLVEEELTFPSHLEEELYHVIQEALNNVLKHAEATSVTVRICALDTNLEVEVEDNGKGFSPNLTDSERGIGLISMQERVEKIGGSLAIESTPGQGSHVHIIITDPS